MLAGILSLKPGGRGLELTRPSTVIHDDRRWNPAVEPQATDRAHRLSQDRKVDVFRMVTQGTVEERMAHPREDKRRWRPRSWVRTTMRG